jgi:hypothetical protein
MRTTMLSIQEDHAGFTTVLNMRLDGNSVRVFLLKLLDSEA